jgi:apolipoprotein N-acyltransferase
MLRSERWLALLSGALLALSFPKFGHPALAWVALAPLIVASALAARRPPFRAARLLALGLFAGLIYFAVTLYWVVPVMDSYGELPWVVAMLVGVLLVVYLAIYPAVFALLTGAAVRRFGIAGVWLAPAFWVALEWVRSWFASGFPWAFLGSSQSSVLPVVQAASLVGVYGLSALVALVSTAAAAVALGADRRAWVPAAGVALLLVVVTVGGLMRLSRGALLSEGTPIRVGLVQANVDQRQKWDPAYREPIVQRYLDLSRRVLAGGAELVVWPEAATPFFFDLEAQHAAPIRRLALETRTPFLIGTDEIVRGPTRPEDEYYNAAVLVGPDGLSRGSYKKMRLVPFGEYVPMKQVLFFVGPLVEAVSSFSMGTEPVVFDAGGRRVSVSICYESIYPWISRAFVARGSQLLATITNDAWFGRSSAAYQHFDQGAIRAVEQGRYVVRAANTGISGAVDPYGRVLARTGLFETDALVVDVRLLDHRTIYSRVGDVAVWIAVALTAGTILLTIRRRS